MPFLRNLLVLAVTSGVAKKAWDRYRENKPGASAGDLSRMRRAGDRQARAEAGVRRGARDSDKPGKG